MTPLRQVFHAALLLAGLGLARPALADPTAVVGPPTAEQAAEASRASAPPAVPTPPNAAARPGASGSSPAWLAPRPSPKPPVKSGSAVPSTNRLIGLLLVLVSLGGAALYFKRRTRVEGPRVAPPKKLTVLSSTRIGPKAHAVVISVAGRQMLLGVTDASVKRLAFIDELVLDQEEEREPARRSAPLVAPRGAARPSRASAPSAGAKGSFSALLKTAFTKRDAAPETDAASILAAETRDTVGGKPVVTSGRMLDVEGQAQGLIRRLSGPRA